MKDEIAVLVPDKDTEQALLGLLSRPDALGIRKLGRFEVVPHPQHDPGVYTTGPELLRPYAREFDHAMVLLDRVWSGAPEVREIQRSLEKRLRPVWGVLARAICIDPELEVWAWSDSPVVAEVLGWSTSSELRQWLEARGAWNSSSPKPGDPKSAYRAALRHRKIAPSSALFRRLGEGVAADSCTDASFRRFLKTLRTWFPRTRERRGSRP